AMTGNICRCSNYTHYVDAVLAAAGAGAASPPVAVHAARSAPAAPLTTVGRAAPRIDGVERTTGKAVYTLDVKLPGMLYARVLRTPHAPARIRSIDVAKARALAGVKAIVTDENCRYVWGAGSIAGGQQYNDEMKRITTQRRFAFNNPVRFAGEPVA